MAHLPIRKKPAPADALNLLPMATILAAGVLATLFWKAGQRPPEQALRDVAHAMPVLTAAKPAVSLEAVRAHVFTVDGRAWVAAPVPPVQFKAEELLPGGSQDGFGLVMNRERGLPEAEAKKNREIAVAQAREQNEAQRVAEKEMKETLLLRAKNEEEALVAMEAKDRAVQVAVTARARVVTLRGSVATFYLKAIAQTVVLAAPGVRGVRNDLAVSPPSPKALPLLVKGAR